LGLWRAAAAARRISSLKLMVRLYFGAAAQRGAGKTAGRLYFCKTLVS
jgi:hypothetical protein